LSVDDPIGKYLPDYPTHGHVITIEMLLNHTSGIKSYTDIDGYMDQAIRTDLTTDELIDVFKNQPMDFAPGDDWRYNNSGYVLLGAIIENISGQSYEDFIADNISAPLELDNTWYGGPKLIPNRASGYGRNADGEIQNAAYLSMTQPHAAGAMLSTTGDLARWHEALTGGEFIHDSSYEKMTTVARLNDGETYPYGYGLGIGQLRERRMIAHGGGINGFTCYSLWLPEEDLYVAVLTNGATGAPGPSTIAKKIAAMTVGDPYPERRAIDLSDADLDGLAGKYQGADFPPVELSIEDGAINLIVGGSPEQMLLAESRNVLFEDGSIDYIEVEWDGPQARRLRFHMEEGAPPDIVERILE
jgi:CubicO group peptidase (beta-lactamase class C family)